MIRIDRIRTAAGDSGETRLGDGSRVRKNCALVEACGEIDELNCVLGGLAARLRGRRRVLVSSVQNDLFDAGADLSVPLRRSRGKRRPLRLTADYCRRLEREMARLPIVPAAGFIIPGGRDRIVWAHLARAVCRRAERRVWALAEAEEINPEIPRYLNCLSDLLFALCRTLEGKARAAYWRPRASLPAK